MVERLCVVIPVYNEQDVIASVLEKWDVAIKALDIEYEVRPCIGRNGQHRYNNMDHSMLCGIEAARALLNGTDRSAVWNVNTEKDYHES